MRKHRKLLIVLACLVVIGGVVVFATRDNEPEYQGKSLSEWLSLYAPASVDPARFEAEDAVLHIGTDALPFLLEDLAYERPQWRRRLARGTPRNLEWTVKWIPFNSDRSIQAIFGFAILGTNAAPAIPALTRLMTNSTGGLVSKRATYALCAIGDPALPVLAVALKDTNTPNRDNIPTGLTFHFARNMTTNLWVPPLVAALSDPDQWVRFATTNALLRIAPELLTNAPAQ